MALGADKPARDWDNNKQEYDIASIGSSARLAALNRNMAAEIAHWLGLLFAAVFTGYDNSSTHYILKLFLLNQLKLSFLYRPLSLPCNSTQLHSLLHREF